MFPYLRARKKFQLRKRKRLFTAVNVFLVCAARKHCFLSRFTTHFFCLCRIIIAVPIVLYSHCRGWPSPHVFVSSVIAVERCIYRPWQRTQGRSWWIHLSPFCCVTSSIHGGKPKGAASFQCEFKGESLSVTSRLTVQFWRSRERLGTRLR